MEELELTSNSALTETVYETSFNGTHLDIRLATGSAKESEQEEIVCNANIYHVSYPTDEEEILFSQPIDANGNKVPVYALGKADARRGCVKAKLAEDEIRRVTSRKVAAHGPIWIYAAIAIGMDKEGSESPVMISQGIGSYGGEDTNESEMIGYVDEKIHNMCALIVRRAHLEKLNLNSIRVGYKYLFVEPGSVGKAKVKEG